MGNSFDLSALCDCGSPCDSCCGDCCPGLTASTRLYATFTGFDSNPTGTITLTWDSSNSWWGKTTVSMGACGTLTFWLICTGTSINDLEMRYTLDVPAPGTDCDYTTDTVQHPWSPQAGSTCSPLNLIFQQISFQDCLGGNCGKGAITLTT